MVKSARQNRKSPLLTVEQCLKAARTFRRLADTETDPQQRAALHQAHKRFSALANFKIARQKMMAAVSNDSRQRYLDRLADRLETLLRQEDNPEEAMKLAGRQLEDNGLIDVSPATKDVREFVDAAVRDNATIYEVSLPVLCPRGWNPKNAETWDALVAHLLV